MEAHHYTDGLAFVPQGTPSNNTADAPSGFSSADPGQEVSYLAERATPAFRHGDGSNADVLAAALGLRDGHPAPLANLSNATDREQVDARHMNRAVWPATWGYFLTQMIGPPLTPDDCAWARQHFIEFVCAAGPLPAVRVGKQPYGVLPVTSLNLWKPRPGRSRHARDLGLQKFCLKRNAWRGPQRCRCPIGKSDKPGPGRRRGKLDGRYPVRGWLGRPAISGRRTRHPLAIDVPGHADGSGGSNRS